MPEFKVNICVTQELMATRSFTIKARNLADALDIADEAVMEGETTNSVTLGGVTYEIPDVGCVIYGFDKPDGWDCEDCGHNVEADAD